MHRTWLLILGLLLLGACSGDVSVSADPTPAVSVEQQDNNDPLGTDGEITVVTPAPQGPSEAEVLEQLQLAALRTSQSSGDFTFSSITSFPGGMVEVNSGGVFDRSAEATAFDVFITEPDPANADISVESTRSYVFVDGEAFYQDEALEDWSSFDPGAVLDDAQIAQGLFLDPTTPGAPPLLELLVAAMNPVEVESNDESSTADATEYLVDIPMSTAYRALGPASYQAFVEDGVDPAGFTGSVPGRVQLADDGFVRAFIVDLSEIFRLAGQDPATPADEAALMLELDITMQVRFSQLDADVSIVRPVPEPTRVDGFFVQGQCYGNVELTSLDILPLDCGEPHLYEVYDVRVRPEANDEPYPGDTSVFDQSLAECRSRFRDLFGLPDETTTVEIYVVYPSRATWTAGDREVACAGQFPLMTTELLGQFDLQRSFGVVTTYGLMPGDCFAETVDFGFVGVPVADCAEDHIFEVYHRQELTVAAFPGETEIEQLADEICAEQFTAFIGVEERVSQHDYTFFWPSAFGWDNLDDRTVTCLVESPVNVQGSLVGTES